MLLPTCHTKRQLSGTTGVCLVLWGFFWKTGQDFPSKAELQTAILSKSDH